MFVAISVLLLMIIAWLLYRLYVLNKYVLDAGKREQGLDEIEQGYQAEIMTLDETVEALREQLHNVYEAHRLLKDGSMQTIHEYDTQIAQLQLRELNHQEIIHGLRAELADVRARALELQIELGPERIAEWEKDLTRPEPKTPNQIFEETTAALEKQGIAWPGLIEVPKDPPSKTD